MVPVKPVSDFICQVSCHLEAGLCVAIGNGSGSVVVRRGSLAAECVKKVDAIAVEPYCELKRLDGYIMVPATLWLIARRCEGSHRRL